MTAWAFRRILYIMADIKEHPIAAVVRRTGLSAHVIRKWEQRYGAVEPGRSSGGHRLYSDDDIRRLNLLSEAVRTGRTIGQVASLPDEKLREYVREDELPDPVSTGRDRQPSDQTVDPGPGRSAEEYYGILLQSAESLDEKKLRETLSRSVVELGQNKVVDRLIPEFMQAVGKKWQHGELRIFQEHLATSAVRSFLGNILESSGTPDSAPVAVAATVEKQHHDIGALISAVVAVSAGWRSVYIGPDIPVEEIAAAANALEAGAVLLSFIYPGDTEVMKEDLEKLSRYLEGETKIIAGGALTAHVSGKATVISDFPSLRDELVRLARG